MAKRILAQTAAASGLRRGTSNSLLAIPEQANDGQDSSPNSFTSPTAQSGPPTELAGSLVASPATSPESRRDWHPETPAQAAAHLSSDTNILQQQQQQQQQQHPSYTSVPAVWSAPAPKTRTWLDAAAGVLLINQNRSLVKSDSSFRRLNSKWEDWDESHLMQEARNQASTPEQAQALQDAVEQAIQDGTNQDGQYDGRAKGVVIRMLQCWNVGYLPQDEFLRRQAVQFGGRQTSSPGPPQDTSPNLDDRVLRARSLSTRVSPDPPQGQPPQGQPPRLPSLRRPRPVQQTTCPLHQVGRLGADIIDRRMQEDWDGQVKPFYRLRVDAEGVFHQVSRRREDFLRLQHGVRNTHLQQIKAYVPALRPLSLRARARGFLKLPCPERRAQEEEEQIGCDSLLQLLMALAERPAALNLFLQNDEGAGGGAWTLDGGPPISYEDPRHVVPMPITPSLVLHVGGFAYFQIMCVCMRLGGIPWGLGLGVVLGSTLGGGTWWMVWRQDRLLGTKDTVEFKRKVLWLVLLASLMLPALLSLLSGPVWGLRGGWSWAWSVWGTARRSRPVYIAIVISRVFVGLVAAPYMALGGLMYWAVLGPLWWHLAAVLVFSCVHNAGPAAAAVGVWLDGRGKPVVVGLLVVVAHIASLVPLAGQLLHGLWRADLWCMGWARWSLDWAPTWARADWRRAAGSLVLRGGLRVCRWCEHSEALPTLQWCRRLMDPPWEIMPEASQETAAEESSRRPDLWRKIQSRFNTGRDPPPPPPEPENLCNLWTELSGAVAGPADHLGVLLLLGVGVYAAVDLAGLASRGQLSDVRRRVEMELKCLSAGVLLPLTWWLLDYPKAPCSLGIPSLTVVLGAWRVVACLLLLVLVKARLPTVRKASFTAWWARVSGPLDALRLPVELQPARCPAPSPPRAARPQGFSLLSSRDTSDAGTEDPTQDVPQDSSETERPGQTRSSRFHSCPVAARSKRDCSL